MHALANTLKKAEKDLLREAEPKRMASRNEDGLIELHKRILSEVAELLGAVRPWWRTKGGTIMRGSGIGSA